MKKENIKELEKLSQEFADKLQKETKYSQKEIMALMTGVYWFIYYLKFNKITDKNKKEKNEKEKRNRKRKIR